MRSRIRQIQQEPEGGFTLIELLIVIVVLGILAGIVVFGIGKFRGDSKVAACKASLTTISVAADAYEAGTTPAGVAHDYPTAVSDLLAAGGNPGYLKDVPTFDVVGTVTFHSDTHTVTSSMAGCTI